MPPRSGTAMKPVKGSKKNTMARDGAWTDGPDPCGGAMSDSRLPKRQKVSHLQPSDAVGYAFLAQYYPKIQTLRSYIIASLPATSRIRRRKIESLGSSVPSPQPCPTPSHEPVELEASLASFLDSTLVVRADAVDQAGSRQQGAVDDRREKWLNFSQKGDESYVTLSNGPAGALFSQSEVRNLLGLLTGAGLDRPAATSH